MLQLTHHNSEINWRIEEVNMIRYLEECEKQQRPKQRKSGQQKQKKEEKKEEKQKKQEEKKQKKEKERKRKKKPKKKKTMYHKISYSLIVILELRYLDSSLEIQYKEIVMIGDKQYKTRIIDIFKSKV